MGTSFGRPTEPASDTDLLLPTASSPPPSIEAPPVRIDVVAVRIDEDDFDVVTVARDTSVLTTMNIRKKDKVAGILTFLIVGLLAHGPVVVLPFAIGKAVASSFVQEEQGSVDQPPPPPVGLLILASLGAGMAFICSYAFFLSITNRFTQSVSTSVFIYSGRLQQPLMVSVDKHNSGASWGSGLDGLCISFPALSMVLLPYYMIQTNELVINFRVFKRDSRGTRRPYEGDIVIERTDWIILSLLLRGPRLISVSLILAAYPIAYIGFTDFLDSSWAYVFLWALPLPILAIVVYFIRRHEQAGFKSSFRHESTGPILDSNKYPLYVSYMDGEEEVGPVEVQRRTPTQDELRILINETKPSFRSRNDRSEKPSQEMVRKAEDKKRKRD